MPRYLVVHLAAYQHSQLSETVHSDPEDSMPEERVATPVLAMEVDAADPYEAIKEAAPAFLRFAPLDNVAVYPVTGKNPTVRFGHTGDSVHLRDPNDE